jgi:hypothetical protein
MTKIITTYCNNQNLEDLKAHIPKLGVDYVVISHQPILGEKNTVVNYTPLAAPDEAIRMAAEYLNSLSKDDLNQEFIFLDWESVFTFSSFERDLQLLVCINDDYDLYIVEEPIRAQDFRLAPYMENLLKIANDLNLPNKDSLFEKNPYVLIPRLIKGNGVALLKSFQDFLNVRGIIQSNKFTGVLPIYNCLYGYRR